MDQEQMRIFISVIDHGSFSKASEQYYISKQAMLKQIARLEEEIGAPLLKRSKRGIAPTKAGMVFYSGAKKILHEEEILFNKCRKPNQVKALRLGSIEYEVLLNPVTAIFEKKYPEVDIQRIVHPNHSAEWRVQHNIMDVGETSVSDNPSIGHSSYTRLTTMLYGAAMRKNNPLAKKKIITLKDLLSYPVFIYPKMLKREYLKEIEIVFKGNTNLIERDDIDNQVGAAYECTNSDSILIFANPFVQSIEELKKIPLATGWTREYGIIYKAPCSDVVQNYINFAVQYYADLTSES